MQAVLLCTSCISNTVLDLFYMITTRWTIRPLESDIKCSFSKLQGSDLPGPGWYSCQGFPCMQCCALATTLQCMQAAFGRRPSRVGESHDAPAENECYCGHCHLLGEYEFRNCMKLNKITGAWTIQHSDESEANLAQIANITGQFYCTIFRLKSPIPHEVVDMTVNYTPCE